MRPTKPKAPLDQTKNGPRPPEPEKLDGTQFKFNLGQYQLSFDAKAFDHDIRAHGIKLIHQRAIPDPRGMASRGDNRDVLDIRPRDSDGFIYKNVAEVTAFFSNNSKDTRVQDIGDIAFSTAYLTFPRFYDGTEKQIYVAQNDRFYVSDIELKVEAKQIVEHSITGIDRLQFPVVEVLELVDANGVWYEPGDYRINADGDIEWLTQKRPGTNLTNNRGTVYSVVYLYTPFFVVDRVLHEIRLAKITKGQSRETVRMPYQVLVLRENLFREKYNNNQRNAQFDSRLVKQPPVGQTMGPQGMPILNNNFNSIEET